MRADERHPESGERRIAIGSRGARLFAMPAVFLIFILGVANFAMHKAVLESGHPLVGQVPRVVRLLGGRVTLVAEFVLLLGAMLLVASGLAGWGWAYLGYTLLNASAAWLILTGKV